jgi:hypothetical protein
MYFNHLKARGRGGGGGEREEEEVEKLEALNLLLRRGGRGLKVYCSEGHQATPARPSGGGRLETS